MYYPPHQSTSNGKHHDGPNVGGGGLGGGWGRFPMPNPGQYPGLGGYPPPGGQGGHHHHQQQQQQHHHPSFGNGNGGMHIPQQNTGYGMGMFGGQQGGSPPRQGGVVESTVPLTAFWQHQLLRAEVSERPKNLRAGY